MQRQRLLLALLFIGAFAACGRPAQSEDCKKMIECANALEAGSGDSAFGPTYGENGKCWLTDDAASACSETCRSLRENMARRPSAPAVCK